MLSAGHGFQPLNRLDLRLLGLLGLALLPIGIIAMLQTHRMIDEANRRVDSSLLGESIKASVSVRRVISQVQGMAGSLALIMPDLLTDPEMCSNHLIETVEGADAVAFVGFVDTDGVVACASKGVGMQVMQPEAIADYLRSPDARVQISGETPISKTAALLVREPVFRDARVIGFVVFSVPYTVFNDIETGDTVKPLDVLSFDLEGTPLTSRAGLAEAERRLPSSRALKALTINDGTVFQDYDNAGRLRTFTVVPLVPGQVFSLAVWAPDASRVGLGSTFATLAFPVLMWLASLGVSYVAVHRLVIRHIRALRRNIRAFSATRRIRTIDAEDLPAELREVTDAFTLMTEQILRDEADQENLLHEKDVLLKEVHHRVKNNLQLIASITSMQIRRARNGETRFMLRRLQDRVMSLATVHRSLYQASVLSEVRADSLVTDLARQLARSANLPDVPVDFTMDTEPVILYPDQAVPLSLLVTEAVTNAYKYLGRPENGQPWVSLTLRTNEDGQVELVVRNSTGAAVIEQDGDEVSGLGSQLIGAFVMQLGGSEESGPQEDGAFQVRVVFVPADFNDDPAGDPDETDQ